MHPKADKFEAGDSAVTAGKLCPYDNHDPPEGYVEQGSQEISDGTYLVLRTETGYRDGRQTLVLMGYPALTFCHGCFRKVPPEPVPDEEDLAFIYKPELVPEPAN